MTNGTRHKTPAAQTERRTFKAHENLVLQVIKRGQRRFEFKPPGKNDQVVFVRRVA